MKTYRNQRRDRVSRGFLSIKRNNPRFRWLQHHDFIEDDRHDTRN
jgi:hypothetical protein